MAFDQEPCVFLNPPFRKSVFSWIKTGRFRTVPPTVHTMWFPQCSMFGSFSHRRNAPSANARSIRRRRRFPLPPHRARGRLVGASCVLHRPTESLAKVSAPWCSGPLPARWLGWGRVGPKWWWSRVGVVQVERGGSVWPEMMGSQCCD